MMELLGEFQSRKIFLLMEIESNLHSLIKKSFIKCQTFKYFPPNFQVIIVAVRMTLQFKLCDVQSDLFAGLNSDDPLAGPGVRVGPGVAGGPDQPGVCGVGPPALSPGVQ